MALKLNSVELLEVFEEYATTRKHKGVMAKERGISRATLDGYLANKDAILAAIQSQT